MSAKTPLWSLLSVSALLAAGCGEKARTSPRPAPAPPTATLTFTGGSLLPARLTLPAGPDAELTIVSADGRPHGVVVTVGSSRRRIVVLPGQRGTLELHGLRPGHRYRVVPDGATEPATLVSP